MTSEERCELTDLLPRDCAHCRGHKDPILSPEPKRVGRSESGTYPVTTAIFGTRCPSCGDFIEVGDTITKIDVGWVCEECGA